LNFIHLLCGNRTFVQCITYLYASQRAQGQLRGQVSESKHLPDCNPNSCPTRRVTRHVYCIWASSWHNQDAQVTATAGTARLASNAFATLLEKNAVFWFMHITCHGYKRTFFFGYIASRSTFHVFICTYASRYMHEYMYTCGYMYMRIYVYVYCMYVYIYIPVHIYMYTHIYTCTNIYTCTYT